MSFLEMSFLEPANLTTLPVDLSIQHRMRMTYTIVSLPKAKVVMGACGQGLSWMSQRNAS